MHIIVPRLAMKLQYFEYDVQIADGLPTPPELDSTSVISLVATHPLKKGYLFYIYPSGSGWKNPGIWAPEILILMQESRWDDASALYVLLKALVRINAERLLGNKQ